MSSFSGGTAFHSFAHVGGNSHQYDHPTFIPELLDDTYRNFVSRDTSSLQEPFLCIVRGIEGDLICVEESELDEFLRTTNFKSPVVAPDTILTDNKPQVKDHSHPLPKPDTDHESPTDHSGSSSRSGSFDLQPLSPLYLRCGILKFHPSVLLSNPPNLHPLAHKWTFPPNALYKQARPDSTRGLHFAHIESAVTRGVLLEDNKDLKLVTTGEHVLLYVGERNQKKKGCVPKIATTVSMVFDDIKGEKAATPIVEDSERTRGLHENGSAQRRGKGKEKTKHVRFLNKASCLSSHGLMEHEYVVDNEGKTERLEQKGVSGMITPETTD